MTPFYNKPPQVGLRAHFEAAAEATGLPVMVAENPLSCVAFGAGRALEDPAYQGVLHAA